MPTYAHVSIQIYDAYTKTDHILQVAWNFFGVCIKLLGTVLTLDNKEVHFGLNLNYS